MASYGIGSVNSPFVPHSDSSPLQGEQSQNSIGGNKKLDMNAFLNMFITQLKYQDPTNPLESYELAAQLAQFSTVEKLTEVNSNLVEIQSYLSSLNNAQMINLIGKEVYGPSDTLIKSGEKISRLSYTTDAPLDVTVKIYDEQDKPVRTINLGRIEPGDHQIAWDGKDDAGEAVKDGRYHCSLDGTDEGGNPVDIVTNANGVVYSFRLEEGIPYLVLDGPDGIKLPISSIQEVRRRNADV